jgi:16S rRNA (cytosine967-C5)-methyltransferase
MNARNAAYIAYLNYLETGAFLVETLETLDLERQTFRLSVEIACGTCRFERALRHYIKETLESSLPRKKKEQALLLTGLYQLFFCESLPPFATVNEMVTIAKKNTHESFVKFLNQALRKASLQSLKPQKSLGIRYSCPDYYVNRLKECYGEEMAETILRHTLDRKKVMVRFRKEVDPSIPLVTPNVGLLEGDFSDLLKRDDLYIQNATPVTLFEGLKEGAPIPTNILDLCASPGGKLILAHDFYPEAKLTANDVSEKKLSRLKENLERLHIESKFTLGRGEDFDSKELYDLILVDAPCSNTGVLHKKPEARWRLSKKEIEEHVTLQKKLLIKAKELLSLNGEIWYSTCSILPEENEEVVAFAKTNLSLVCRKNRLQHQNSDGYDGGFAASLRRLK